LNSGYELSRNLEEYCTSMSRIYYDDEDKIIRKYCLEVIDSLGSYKEDGLFTGDSRFQPDFQRWRLLEAHSGSYTHYIPSKLGKKTDITSFINSNLEFWKALGAKHISEIPLGFDRLIVETSKAPSKHKVTRAELDFLKAENKKDAEREQQRKEKASKANKDKWKKRKDDKRHYLRELRKLEKDANRTSWDGKKGRDAKRALDDYKRANKGKYENDES
jgi:hypothetical protein